MTLGWAADAAAAAGCGFVAMVGAWVYARRARVSTQLLRDLAWGCVGGAIAWVLTDWPVAAGVGVLIGASVPVLRRQDRARTQDRARIEAMGAWIAQVRACLAGGSSVTDSLSIATERAPAAVRADFEPLREQLKHTTAEQALVDWAAGVSSDMTSLAASLVLVIHGRGGYPAELLAQLVAQWRERAAALRRLERDRAQLRWSARAAGALALGIPLLLRFMDPAIDTYYRSLAHQGVLALGLGLVLASVAIWSGADYRAGRLL